MENIVRELFSEHPERAVTELPPTLEVPSFTVEEIWKALNQKMTKMKINNQMTTKKIAKTKTNRKTWKIIDHEN